MITVDANQQFSDALRKNPKDSANQMKGLIAQLKPEAAYFSTTRRHGLLVVEVKDPHGELRTIYENLSKMGQVTVDPVSNFEEFSRWIESLS